MDKYILEIPNFIPSDICQAIIKRFENDGGKGEGSFTYMVGDRSVSQKKYNTELNIQVLSGWDDITTLFIEYTAKVYDEYLKHLKKNLNSMTENTRYILENYQVVIFFVRGFQYKEYPRVISMNGITMVI